METITSAKNPKVQLWKSLKDRKGRRENGQFLVEGRKMTEEALRSGFSVTAVLIDADRPTEGDLPEGIPVYALPTALFASVCDTKTPQGIAAVLRLPASGNVPKGKRLVAMDGVQDPGNVGTIIRTADAAGMDGVLLSRECADLFSPKVLRATMGSIFRMELTVTDHLAEMLEQLKRQGCSILSSQLDGEPFYQRQPVGEHFCLIIGNEGNGVSPEVQQTATHRLRLPMRGGAESLNAAIAAGIMMYELNRDLPD